MAGSEHKIGREMERQCAVTRERRSPGALLRFAVDPDGNVVPDLKSVLPGRGVWITCDRDTLEKAVSAKVFDRAFKQAVKVPEALKQSVEGLLERDALQKLSLANKAGAVVCGFDKVASAVKAGKIACLVHGSDASADGACKLNRILAAVAEAQGGLSRIVSSFNCEQLSLALGGPNVVHAALKIGAPAENFLTATERLDRLRASPAASDAAQVRKTEDE